VGRLVLPGAGAQGRAAGRERAASAAYWPLLTIQPRHTAVPPPGGTRATARAAPSGPASMSWPISATSWPTSRAAAASGDHEMVRLANELLSACMALMGVSTERQPATSVADRVRRWVAGERLTPEMQGSIDNGRKELAHARERFANHARHILGQSSVTLFGHIGDHDRDAIGPPARSP
jgi:hypothetical protein